MKKKLLITENEKNYIRNLYGLIPLNEQENIEGEKLNFNLGSLFLDGKYVITPTIEEKIKKEIKDNIIPFLERNPGTILNINVLAGESATTNVDTEINDRVYKPNYYLAEKRRESLTNWLVNYFETAGIIPKPVVDERPNQRNVNIFRGQTGVEANDRYIKFDVTAVAPGTCLIGLTIDVIYVETKDKRDPAFPCRGLLGKEIITTKLAAGNETKTPFVPGPGNELGGHNCNNAQFRVFLNNTAIGDVNLNNARGLKGVTNPQLVDDGSKIGTVKVTREQAIEIANEKNPTVVLSLQCLSQLCHSDIPEIKITNKFGVLYHSCTPTEKAFGNQNRLKLLTLDQCALKVLSKTTRSETGAVQTEKNSSVTIPEFIKRNTSNPNGILTALPDGTYQVKASSSGTVELPSGIKVRNGDIVDANLKLIKSAPSSSSTPILDFYNKQEESYKKKIEAQKTDPSIKINPKTLNKFTDANGFDYFEVLTPITIAGKNYLKGQKIYLDGSSYNP